MRILVISNLFPPHYLGGAELLCAQVVERLAARHEVHVICSDFRVAGAEDGNYAFPVERSLSLYLDFGVIAPKPLHRRLPTLRTDRRNGRILRETIGRFAPDLVFVWSQRRLGVGVARACQLAGLQTVFIFNDDSPRFFIPDRLVAAKPRSWLLGALDRSLFRAHTTLALDLARSTCISQSLKDELLDEGLPIRESEVIFQGIPLERFPPKAEPGSLHSPLRLLYVGQILHSKGVHTLVEAADMVAARRGPGTLSVTIVGGGQADYRENLPNYNKSGFRLDFAGKLAPGRLPEVYRDHDVLAFPSIVREGFGLTFLEAMASGTTVLSTASGGQGECLRDGGNALVFPAGDAKALAACIERLMDEPDLSRRLAVEARAMVERDFSLEVYTSRLEDFLTRSLAPAPRG